MDRAASDPPRGRDTGRRGRREEVYAAEWRRMGSVAGESGMKGDRALVTGQGGVGFARGCAAPRYMLEEENGSSVDTQSGGDGTGECRRWEQDNGQPRALCRRAGLGRRGRDGRMGGSGVNYTGELGLGNGEEELSEIGEGRTQ
jgi:hypothetical protein